MNATETEGISNTHSIHTSIYEIQQQKSGVKELQANNCLIEHTIDIAIGGTHILHNAESIECVCKFIVCFLRCVYVRCEH